MKKLMKFLSHWKNAAAVFFFACSAYYMILVVWINCSRDSLTPLERSDVSAVLWIPPGAILANPPGKVAHMNLRNNEVQGRADLSIEDFRKMEFDFQTYASVLVTEDGEVLYRAQRGQFFFEAKDNLKYRQEKMILGTGVSLKEVIPSQDGWATLRYEKSWDMSYFVFWVSFLFYSFFALLLSAAVAATGVGILWVVFVGLPSFCKKRWAKQDV